MQSRLLRAARRLQETVGVCFQVRVGDDAAEDRGFGKGGRVGERSRME